MFAFSVLIPLLFVGVALILGGAGFGDVIPWGLIAISVLISILVFMAAFSFWGGVFASWKVVVLSVLITFFVDSCAVFLLGAVF